MTQPPAGWYANPENLNQVRWWDGSHWTEHVQAAPTPGPEIAMPGLTGSADLAAAQRSSGSGVSAASGTGFGLGIAAFFLFGFPVLGPLICVAAIIVSTTALVRRPPGASRKDKVFAIVGLVLGVIYTLMALIWAVTGRM
ncbi:DUF2510 domain-containing protein [Pseudarthrobacter oxydans]|uniref:DUF2510 domain-containing protein n=1 Tax=Pseudarthrobacter oxydans TaxID=1671 RepID=UPI003801EBE0